MKSLKNPKTKNKRKRRSWMIQLLFQWNSHLKKISPRNIGNLRAAGIDTKMIGEREQK